MPNKLFPSERAALPERLDYVRELRGWRKSDLAKYAGIGKSAVTNVYKGESGLSLESLEQISRNGKVDAWWLLTGEITPAAALTEAVPGPELAWLASLDEATRSIALAAAHAAVAKLAERTSRPPRRSRRRAAQ